MTEAGLSDAGGDRLRDGHAPSTAVHRFASHTRCDFVRFVLGHGLQRKQPPKVLLDLYAVWAGPLEQHEDLVVIFTGGPLTEPGTAHGIGGVDGSVDRQTGCGDVSLGVQLARCSLGVLVAFRAYART